MRLLLWIGIGFCALVPSSMAHAQATEVYGARAAVAAQAAANNEEDATAAGNTIELRSRNRGHEDLADVLQEVPAVRIRRTGNVGSYVGAALRGADDDHTSVLLNTVPLSAVDAGPFDLSTIPPEALDRVEVFRGGAPAWYSEGAIGGVLHFQPRRAPFNLLRSELLVGPYGLRSARATAAYVASQAPNPAALAHVSGTMADNNYDYLDDNGTRFDPSDDVVRRQHNARVRQLQGLLQAGLDALGGRIELTGFGYLRDAGVPGPLSRPTRDAHQKLAQGNISLSYLRERSDAHGERTSRLQWVLGIGAQRNRLLDPNGELGMQKADIDDHSQRGFMRLALGQRLLPYLEGTLIATFAHDAYMPHNSLLFVRQDRSTRSTWAVVAEPRLYGRPFGLLAELRPSIRYAVSRTVLHGQQGLTEVDEDKTITFPTYRVAGLIAPLNGLSLTASVASGTRIPTMVEYFGDRAVREPNPQLQPERALNMDVGAVYRLRTSWVKGTIELRGFSLAIDDIIQYVQTSQKTSRPENLSFGKVLGLEFGMRTEWLRHVSLTAALTLMNSENPYGLRLAYHPPVQAMVRPGLSLPLPFRGQLHAFAEMQHIADVHVDKSNIAQPLGGRTTFALGASADFLAQAIALGVQLQNIFDTPITDVLFRPLPGRRLLFTLSLGQGQ